MSMESAMAVLSKAAPMDAPRPAVNPDTAEVVVDKAKDAVKDLNINVKVDAPKPLDVPAAAPKAPEATKPPEPEVKEEPVSQRFALLAKKEKALLRTQQELKAKETLVAEARSKLDQFEKYKAQVRENPMLALKDLGISYDDITKYVLSGKMPQGEGRVVEELKAELQALRDSYKADKEAEEKQAKERAERRAQETLVAFKEEIGEYIKTNADKYELINLNEANNLVFQVIEKHYKDTQRVMTIEQGCEIVEKYLDDQVNKNLAAKKVAERLAPKATTKQAPTTQPRTLTNELTASAPSMLPARTESDRIARALAALDKQ